MAFSYSLFVILILLFPGLFFRAGLRAGEQSDFLTPAPDRPGSTSTLLIVMMGTVLGHILGTGFFAALVSWRKHTSLCIDVGFDPNPYKALLRGSAAAREIPDLALQIWLLAFFFIAVATGSLAYWMARRDVLTDRTDPIAYGWLNPAVQAVKKGNAFVVAYVPDQEQPRRRFSRLRGRRPAARARRRPVGQACRPERGRPLPRQDHGHGDRASGRRDHAHHAAADHRCGDRQQRARVRSRGRQGRRRDQGGGLRTDARGPGACAS